MESVIVIPVTQQALVSDITAAVLAGLDQALSARRENSNSQNILLTRKEVGELLKISMPTINEWSKKGILKPHKINSRIRYKECEVMEALKEVESKRL